ncbi:MAG: prepilin-type N-terminal cleavage/methylation domain-containing protein, partial [Pusillimonas sp.]
MNQRGFTLIEVLVALALMALLSIISWRALDLVERSSNRLNASADDTLALLRVLGQIESDVSQSASADILPQAAS